MLASSLQTAGTLTAMALGFASLLLGISNWRRTRLRDRAEQRRALQAELVTELRHEGRIRGARMGTDHTMWVRNEGLAGAHDVRFDPSPECTPILRQLEQIPELRPRHDVTIARLYLPWGAGTPPLAGTLHWTDGDGPHQQAVFHPVV